MSGIALSTLHRLATFAIKEPQLFSIKAYYKTQRNILADAAVVLPGIIQCKCCNWEGESSETKQEFLFLPYATELELFCPKCNRYLCFVSGKAEK